MDIKINLKKFIVTEMMFEKDTTLLNDDQHLLETGIIDSMDILVLVSFMEKQFGIKLYDEDLVPDNFQTINNLKDLIERKQLSQLKVQRGS